MRMSTRGRYGLRAMIELAIRHGGPPARLRDVADSQDIPLAYLRELMTALAARGLVRAVRGPRGGYVLSRDPSVITAKDVVEPLEGPIVLVECTDEPSLCKRSPFCGAMKMWERLTADMRKTMASMTLDTLAADESHQRTEYEQAAAAMSAK